MCCAEGIPSSASKRGCPRDRDARCSAGEDNAGNGETEGAEAGREAGTADALAASHVVNRRPGTSLQIYSSIGNVLNILADVILNILPKYVVYPGYLEVVE